MRLGIEALHVNTNYITGIERYFFLTLEALSDIRENGNESEPSEIVVFSQDRLERLAQYQNLKIKNVIVTEDSFEALVDKENLDILHCTFIPPSREVSCPVLYTLHDAGRYIYPDLMDKVLMEEHKRRINNLLSGGKCLLLTVSNAAKKDICNTMDMNPCSVCVAPLFVSREFRERLGIQQEDKEILLSIGINQPFILAIGCFTPTKNIKTVIEAFKKAKEGSTLNDPILIIIGRQGWDNTGEELSRSSSDIKRIEFVSDDQLIALYRNCNLFVSASLIEGFGLPVIEAAYLNTPILCSDIGSYREIIGDQGEYFVPTNTSQLSKLILRTRRIDVNYKNQLKNFSSFIMGNCLIDSYRKTINL